MLLVYLQASRTHIIAVYLTGHVWFENPGFKFSVMLSDAAVKVKAQAGYRVLVADICKTQASCGQSTDMFSGVNDHHRILQLFGRVRGNDTGGRGTIHANIGL